MTAASTATMSLRLSLLGNVLFCAFAFSKKMAANNLKQEQLTFVRNMIEQGIMDSYTEEVLELRDVESPQFVIDVISTFLRDADDCIAQLSTLLSEQVMDYERAAAIVHRVKGSCSSMGGCRTARAFGELRNACDDMVKERCLELFERVKEEYQILKGAFNSIAQVETNIVSREAGEHQG